MEILKISFIYIVLIYLSNYNISQAIQIIKEKNQSDEIKSILKFIENSERGII